MTTRTPNDQRERARQQGPRDAKRAFIVLKILAAFRQGADVQRQGPAARTHFQRVDSLDGGDAARIATDAVDGVGGENHDSAPADHAKRLFDRDGRRNAREIEPFHAPENRSTDGRVSPSRSRRTRADRPRR